jgi:hypothetical protein
MGVPKQVPPAFVNDGVTVIVAVTVDPLLLIAVNEAIFPLPLAARPIEVVLLVQLKTTPPGVPLNVTVVVDVFVQIV